MKYLFYFCSLITYLHTSAQCNEFDNLIIRGNNYLIIDKPNYKEAINAYAAAIIACSNRASEAQQCINRMVNDINKIKDKAIAAEKMIKSTLVEVQREKLNTQKALSKANELIKAIYFYDNKYAVAFEYLNNHQIAYFIDSSGIKVTHFGIWENARNFDWRGFAYVNKIEFDEYTNFFIDTTGKQFRMTWRISDLNKSVTALDLKNQKLTSLTAEMFNHSQLEILLLNNNEIRVIPPEIQNLQNLSVINLYSNNLKYLPIQISLLPKLSYLNIGNNQLIRLPPEIG